MQRLHCLIYNGTLETLILLKMWRIYLRISDSKSVYFDEFLYAYYKQEMHRETAKEHETKKMKSNHRISAYTYKKFPQLLRQGRL